MNSLLNSIAKEFFLILKDKYKKLSVDEVRSALEYSKHSDIAFTLACKENFPKEEAETIVNVLKKNSISIEDISFTDAGFINLKLKKNFLLNQLESNKTFDIKDSSVKKVIEYTDPNPFKEFHIGHLMTNTIGESIARISAVFFDNVYRVNYQGDVGLHTAKAVWGLLKLGKEINIKTLAEAYIYATEQFEKSEIAVKEIRDINVKIYNKSDEKLNKIYTEGRNLSLEYFEEIYKLLGTKFDTYFFESVTSEYGKKKVLEYIESGVFEKSDNAIIYREKDTGLVRVFLTSEGLPTYEAKEIGLAFLKNEKYPGADMLIITANEIIGYMKTVKLALGEIDSNLAKNIKHLPHGVMTLEGDKMSSRDGNILSALDLISGVKQSISKYNADIDESIIQKISIAAIKFWILKQSSSKNISFNKNDAISIHGDTGVYVLYSIVRARKLLKELKDNKKSQSKINNISQNQLEVFFNKELILELVKFNDVIKKASDQYAPHLVAQYILNLAHKWNSFYADTQILKTEEEGSKLLLVCEIERVLTLGTDLLGIESVDRM